MRYFGRIDIDAGDYETLYRLDQENNIGQFYAAGSDEWKDTENAFEAPYDTTYYDELTKDQAIELKARMKAKYFKA